MAILSRAASKSREALPYVPSKNVAQPSSSTSGVQSDYRPSSMESFLGRLTTYKLATYSNKPAAIDAVAASRCGWMNNGKDRLLCGICGVSWVVVNRDGMTRDAGKKVGQDSE